MKNGGLRYSNASKDEEGKGISPILGERMEARAMTLALASLLRFVH
jgi:hypothetical protein